MKKKLLIIQPMRYGDIIICLPIAKWYENLGFDVYWWCYDEYFELFDNIDYVKPVSKKNIDLYDKIVDIGFCVDNNKELDNWFFRNMGRFNSFIDAKYELANVPVIERWNLEWNRNIEKENMLYDKVVNDRKEYILVHEDASCGKLINLEFDNMVKVTKHNNFNIFDWYKIIINAKEIHAIDSSFANFVEVINGIENKSKTMYLSKRNRKNKVINSLYNKNWKIC